MPYKMNDSASWQKIKTLRLLECLCIRRVMFTVCKWSICDLVARVLDFRVDSLRFDP